MTPETLADLRRSFDRLGVAVAETTATFEALFRAVRRPTCTCGVRTPDPAWHAVDCPIRNRS